MWTGKLTWAQEWDFAQIWLDLVQLMLHWESKPSSFPHPRCPRCNHWPSTHHPCHFSNSWPFGEIWDDIGPPREVWCQFGNFGILLTIGFQSHSKHLWCIYKPINKNFRVINSKIILFPTITVCNLTIIWWFLLNLAPKFDLWNSLMLLDSPLVRITHFLVQIYHT